MNVRSWVFVLRDTHHYYTSINWLTYYSEGQQKILGGRFVNSILGQQKAAKETAKMSNGRLVYCLPFNVARMYAVFLRRGRPAL